MKSPTKNGIIYIQELVKPKVFVMAYNDMNDFLKRYFRQMHVDHMSPDVIARFQDDYKKGLLNKDQLDWVNTYFTISADGKLVKKPLPDQTLGSELNDDPQNNQGRKLYVELFKTLAKMKGVSHLYGNKDKSASDFLKRWFETEKLQDGSPAFGIPKANATTEGSITAFLNLLGYGSTQLSPDQQALAEQLKQVIRENTLKDNGTDKVFDDPYAVNDFLQKCKDGKYNEDNKVQDKLLKVASALKNYVLSHYDAEDIPTVAALKRVDANGVSMYQHLENMSSDNAFDRIEISDANLVEFRKNKLPVILQKLYEDQNVRSRFKDHDQSKIVIDQLEKYSENKVNWQDANGDNYVQPKLDDVRTPLQQLEKWAGDTYDDTLKKYEELRGAHLFKSPFAKEICKAIDKEKIKPVDGVEGLLAKKDAIKKRFENKNVAQHFDWFTSTMEDLTGKIPNAMKGCWKDARQMKCVIQNIILKATDPRTSTDADMEKAKTAMEIMTVMKYGMLTSKVMDAMRKEEFSMFSDGKLSWNKNEGIQFVTKAFDKSIKAAFLGVGYGITFARNKIMMRGMEFTNENNQSGPAKTRINELKNSSSTEKQNLQNSLGAHQTELQQQQNARNQLIQQNGTEQQINQNIQNYQSGMNSLQQTYDEYNNYKQIVDGATQLTQQIADKDTEIQAKQAEVQQDLTAFNNIPAYSNMPQSVLDKKQEEAWMAYEQAKNDLDALIQQKADLENQQRANQPNVTAAQNGMNLRQGAHDHYEQLKADLEDQTQKKNQLEEATRTVNELTTTITNEQNALSTWDNEHKNKFIELQNYWNFLQSGNAKTWRLFTKNAQEQFDTNSAVLYQNYVNSYGLTP